MSARTPDGEELARELERLARRTADDLAQRRAVRAASRETPRALWLALLVPAAVLVVDGVRAAANAHPDGSWFRPSVPQFLLIALAAAVPVAAAVVLRAQRARRERVTRARALAVLDRHLHLFDRLVTADEFLALPARGGFELAAIEDARRAIHRASGAVLPQVEFVFRPDRRAVGTLAAALLLAWGAAAIDPGVPRDGGRGDDRGLPAASGDEVATAPPRAERESEGRDAATEERVVPPREPRQREPQDAVRADARATEVPETVKESKGSTREGESSDAQSSSGAGSAKGSPSNQEQTSKGEALAKQEPKKPKADQDARADEQPERKRAEEDSGSTAGRGSARGSNKNAVATPWSSKDQVDTPDDQEIEDDDEFEDDAEEQKARGGMQPNLRDRRPPVSRDLSIGFGNRPSPDANGRGGPSEQKKSRGTASLVLGVPVPDRVKGQPNRGKTKITQERVEPRAEVAEPVPAGERAPSAAPLGSVPAPEAAPWVRDAVRRYFMALRERDAAALP